MIREEVRYGVIGAGMMAQEHIRYINMLPGTRVTALCDPNPEMLAASAALADGAKTFVAHRALLESDLADVLLIASPNQTHAAILEDAMAGDWPIMVEKPLCINVAEGERLVEMGKHRQAPVWVAMEYRYMPPMARLLEAIRAGHSGTIRMVAIREHRYPFLDKVGHWNRFQRTSGGTLVEKCCHFFDLMRLILKDEAIRVYASGAGDVNHGDERYDGETPDVIDNALVVVDFAGGARAMLELCMFAEGSYFQEEVAAIGDIAKLEAKVPGPARFQPGSEHRQAEFVMSPRATRAPIREVTPVDERVLLAGDHHGSTYFQHQRFLEMVRTGGSPDVTLEDGLRAVEIGLAAERSAKMREAVALAPAGADAAGRDRSGGFAASL